MNNPLAGTDPTGYAIKCDNVKPSDVPAGGSTSCTVTEDRPGSRIKTTTNVEVSRSQDGTRSYIQVGATASNGARSQQGVTGNARDGSSKGAQAIEGAESRDRMQFGLSAVKDGLNTAGELLSPCSGAVSAGDCAQTVAWTAGAGVVIGLGGKVVLRAGKEGLSTASKALRQVEDADKVSAATASLMRVGQGRGGSFLLPFGPENYRYNLKAWTGLNPASNVEAHHIFVQEYRGRFAQLGINIDDPRFLTWWDRAPHQASSRQISAEWDRFFVGGSEPTTAGAFDLARQQSERYGFRLGF